MKKIALLIIGILITTVSFSQFYSFGIMVKRANPFLGHITVTYANGKQMAVKGQMRKTKGRQMVAGKDNVDFFPEGTKKLFIQAVNNTGYKSEIINTELITVNDTYWMQPVGNGFDNIYLAPLVDKCAVKNEDGSFSMLTNEEVAAILKEDKEAANRAMKGNFVSAFEAYFLNRKNKK